MEPWLDSLSEDWNSEPRSSSPTNSIHFNPKSSLNQSQSRIPHLVQNLQANNRQTSYLKPRSSRGIARSRTTSILIERSASSLNVQGSSPRVSSQKQQKPLSLPRRPSSAFSGSQNSVQHHNIERKPDEEETLEWKRRLANPDDTIGDGLDLFSPSKLEGMFKQSSGPIEPDFDDHATASDSRPWSSIRLGSFPNPSEQYSSYRTSRGRGIGMEVLQEVNEEDDEQEPDFSAISSDIAREGSMRGLVKRCVSNYEQERILEPETQSSVANDPRLRTISGQRELKNEVISPITASKQNTIREHALMNSLDLDTNALRERLLQNNFQTSTRPSSRSSDHDVSYDGLGYKDETLLHEERLAEMTSQSLPEDLSMGTQDFVPPRRLTSKRSAIDQGEQSFVIKPVGSSADVSHLVAQNQFRSSPPPYRRLDQDDIKENTSEDDVTEEEEGDASVLHHDVTSPHLLSSGSPLKLFGNRDTYTNNKLMRILTHYEQNDQMSDQIQSAPVANIGDGSELRMSQFGQGELDGFDFKQEVQRMITNEDGNNLSIDGVFTNLLENNPNQINPNTAENAAHQNESNAQNPATTEDEVNQTETRKHHRSPKRRRTLLQDDATVQHAEVQHRLESMTETSLAGTKRKDARDGKMVEQASPQTLASRPILRPKSGSRKSSMDEQQVANSVPSSQRLKEALAAELQSFAEGMNISDNSSRKPSLATKDYMAEANKVMEFIRARGKPKVSLPDIEEPEEASELQADVILDLEVDDSTKDSFSRPPSREGPVKPRTDRRHAQHNPSVASHLRKFRDSEDLDLLTSTSALGTLHLVDNEEANEAAAIPIPEEQSAVNQQESSPPGMRILNQDEAARKRKHSNLSYDTQTQEPDSMKQTMASNSSSSSGRKGMIASGTVSIPDQVGVMTFDHDKQKWVKHYVRKPLVQNDSRQLRRSLQRQSASEADPFEDIPDLSIDEQREAAMQVQPRSSTDHHTLAAMEKETRTDSYSRSEFELNDEDEETHLLEEKASDNETCPKPALPAPRVRAEENWSKRPTSQDSKASKHEEMLYEGLPSKDPHEKGTPPRQARVVTIAFSSPIASEIPYHKPPSVSDADIDEDDPSLLPLDDDSPSPSSPNSETQEKQNDTGLTQPRNAVVGDPTRHEQYRAMTLNRRPASRIDEYEEEQYGKPDNLSLVRIEKPEMTPIPSRSLPLTTYSGKKDSSMLCLTPLSDFTLHQVDQLNHPEESYVANRPNPKTLRHAHGSHAQVEDALVKAITDAVPEELFWEQLKRVSLKDGRLATLHGLKDYCRSLEILDVSCNKISQLVDMPPTLRNLNISANLLNDLTSWGHLQNLQYVDVSSNELESLEAFHSLVHLRRLDASNNKIRVIDGILDLDALISLNVSKNELSAVDFSSADLLRLEDLDLSENDLVSISGLHCLQKLTRLNMAENSLRDLEIAVDQQLVGLESLILCQNELSSIDLTYFPSLKMLDISRNSIGEIFGLSNAQGLDVLIGRDQRNTDNLLNMVLSTQNECSEIYLSSNVVSNGQISLPTTPQYNLRCLELAGCGIQNLPPSFGDFFPNCRVLNLNFNAIQDLSPLIGILKLKHLFLARNRIKRMRRTCLTLSRLPGLTKVDIRDNPLTVGFYAPFEHSDASKNYINRLPHRSRDQDQKWWKLLDDVTWDRRRAVELLLAECCANLAEVDGLVFDRAIVLEEHEVVNRLATIGVLKRSEETEASTASEIKRAVRSNIASPEHSQRLVVQEARSSM